MKIAVVIPTYRRLEKLKRCLASLENQTYQDLSIYVFCDNNDQDTYNYFSGNFKIYSYLNSKQEYVVGSWNKFFQLFANQYDGVLWCVDDVVLNPRLIREAVRAMEDNFPDTDGVIGLRQECPGHPEYTFKWYGQVLIGRKFIERYKDVDYKVCCPDYKHFYQDEEMYMYANSLGKFFRLPEPCLLHYHPAFIKEELDDTHPMVRGEVKKRDDQVYKVRRHLGYIWGKTFDLVC